jgi:hypothetical protein
LEYEWPNSYPPACPPGDAVDAEGEFFRIVDAEPPVESDFWNHHERAAEGMITRRTWSDGCEAAGLSVLQDLEEAKNLREAVGPMRSKKIAHGSLSGSGVMKASPRSKSQSHHTWWRPVGDQAWISFTVVT